MSLFDKLPPAFRVGPFVFTTRSLFALLVASPIIITVLPLIVAQKLTVWTSDLLCAGMKIHARAIKSVMTCFCSREDEEKAVAWLLSREIQKKVRGG